MFEPEFVDDENIPLLHRDDDIDDSVYEDSQAETSFNNDDVIQQEANENSTQRSMPWSEGLTLKYLLKSEVDLECLVATFKWRSLQVNMPISQSPTVNS